MTQNNTEEEWWEEVIKDIELLYQIVPQERGAYARSHDLKLWLKGIVEESQRRTKQEIREEIEKLKYTKESPSVFEVSFNLAVDNILKEI